MAQLKTKGLTFEYDEFGKKDDPAIILIMGFSAQMVYWNEKFCAGLADQGFRVIRFDNRDVGLSEKIESAKRLNLPVRILLKTLLGYRMKSPYSISDMGRDVIDILDALQIPKAHLVGASMGGMISLVLGLEHSERILSVSTIFAPTNHPKDAATDKKVIRAITTSLKDDASLETRVDGAIEKYILLAGKYPLEESTREILRLSLERSFYLDGIGRQLAAIIAEPPLTGRLKNMTRPLLVLHGSEDPLVPLVNGQNIAAEVPNAELVVFEGMGHTLPPVLFADFIERISRHAKTHSN